MQYLISRAAQQDPGLFQYLGATVKINQGAQHVGLPGWQGPVSDDPLQFRGGFFLQDIE